MSKGGTDRFVGELSEALGPRLVSVVLYGSAAGGDFQEATSDLNLLVVVDDLAPATLEALTTPFQRWTRGGQPLPRVFSRQLIRDSADVFPIELLDIRSRRRVLFGEDPFADLEVQTGHLRLQCERELREKMMRLREGYIESHGRPKQLRELLVASYGTFVALFRGCLRLLGEEVPANNDEVAQAFCARAGVDPAPFDDIARLRRGESPGDPRQLFSRYYEGLTHAVQRVDRF